MLTDRLVLLCAVLVFITCCGSCTFLCYQDDKMKHDEKMKVCPGEGVKVAVDGATKGVSSATSK
jgi:hypothetical protein